jgi:hypothetical protein
MKSKMINSALSTILICIGLAFVLAAPPPAQAQVTGNTFGTFDNVPALMTASSTSNVVSTGVSVRQGKGMAIMPYFVDTNSTAANLIFKFNVSYDGTNWGTTLPILITNALNGTTAVRGFFNIPPDTLNNVRQLRLQSIVNGQTNTVWITNVVWSVGN